MGGGGGVWVLIWALSLSRGLLLTQEIFEEIL